MKVLSLLGVAIYTVAMLYLIVVLKDMKIRKKKFEKEELEKLHDKNLVGTNSYDELELYNKIRSKYTEVTINIALEKRKVREELGLYSNQKANEFLTKLLFLMGGLIGAIFSAFTDTNEEFLLILAFVVIILGITRLIDNKSININEAKIKYYSMCLVVLEELELEKLNINKNKEV